MLFSHKMQAGWEILSVLYVMKVDQMRWDRFSMAHELVLLILSHGCGVSQFSFWLFSSQLPCAVGCCILTARHFMSIVCVSNLVTAIAKEMN